jgi:hypothetical protein
MSMPARTPSTPSSPRCMRATQASALGQQLLGPGAGKPALRLLGAAPSSTAGDDRGLLGESRVAAERARN